MNAVKSYQCPRYVSMGHLICEKRNVYPQQDTPICYGHLQHNRKLDSQDDVMYNNTIGLNLCNKLSCYDVVATQTPKLKWCSCMEWLLEWNPS